MKTLFLLLLTGFCVFLSASEPQKMPEFKTPLLKKNLNIIDGVSTFRIIENKDQKGVIAWYRTFYPSVDFSKRPGDAGFVNFAERNKTRERVFITGLNHDLVTTDGVIFHKIIGVGQKGLWVWRIGTENVSFKYSYSRRNRTMRLKKFTVDPKEAAAYYSKKSGADKAVKSSVIATGRK